MCLAMEKMAQKEKIIGVIEAYRDIKVLCSNLNVDLEVMKKMVKYYGEKKF